MQPASDVAHEIGGRRRRRDSTQRVSGSHAWLVAPRNRASTRGNTGNARGRGRDAFVDDARYRAPEGLRPWRRVERSGGRGIRRRSCVRIPFFFFLFFFVALRADVGRGPPITVLDLDARPWPTRYGAEPSPSTLGGRSHRSHRRRTCAHGDRRSARGRVPRREGVSTWPGGLDTAAPTRDARCPAV